MTSLRPKERDWSAPATVGSSSAILWSARPFTTTPRPVPGARSTALWPTPFPTSRSTGAPGTWPSPYWARTMPPARLWSRPAPGRATGALTTWRQGLSSAPPSWRHTTRGAAGSCTRPPIPPGWAAWPFAPRNFSMRRATCGLTPELTASVDNLKGHIAARLGRVGEGQEILAQGRRAGGARRIPIGRS